MAEREGFEPSVPVTQYARLAIWCLRPLGHLSASPTLRAIPQACARSICPARGSHSTTFWQISGIFGEISPAAASDRSPRSASLRSGLGVHRALNGGQLSRPWNGPSNGPRRADSAPRKEAIWHKRAGTDRGLILEPRKPKQTESSSAHHLETGRSAGVVTENQRAPEPDSGLLLGKRGAHGRQHVHLALAVGNLRQTLAEARQIPHDDNDAAIKVDILA